MDAEEASHRRWVLAPFVDFLHFQEQCIAILNKEWPRSHTQRETSFRRASNRKPPMALLLLSEDGAELGGHARLCELPQDVEGCWVESVILREDLRGKGIGRLLMELLQRRAKELGFKKMYLSTEDKQKFYERCGFSCCPPVLNAGASGSLLAGRNLSRLLVPSPSQPVPLLPRTSSATVSTGAPPPPPPPPVSSKQMKPVASKKFDASTPKQYMVKDL